MQRYILKRLLQGFICLWFVSVLVFSLSRITGDPLTLMMPPEATQAEWDALRVKLGLDKPLIEQYWVFLSGAVRGDFGRSLKWNEPVLGVYFSRLPISLVLATASILMSMSFGMLLGIVAAVRRGYIDKIGSVVAVVGQAVPVFWLGIMLIMVFAVWLKVLPSSGAGGLKYLILPTFCLALFFLAALFRMTRSAMLDVLDTDYIKMARMKGLSEVQVVGKHALRNATIPILTLAAQDFATLLQGAVLVEVVFNWPGVGRLAYEAVMARDFPVIQTCLLFGALWFIIVNLVTDLTYAYVDPRIRYT